MPIYFLVFLFLLILCGCGRFVQSRAQKLIVVVAVEECSNVRRSLLVKDFESEKSVIVAAFIVVVAARTAMIRHSNANTTTAMATTATAPTATVWTMMIASKS